MSRRDGRNSVTQFLSGLIDSYKESKDRETLLKTQNNELNKQINDYILQHDLTNAESESCKATVTRKDNESLNEELAIEIIKENLSGALLSSVIKQKEYIDEDALEKLVYNGDFDINKLAKAKIVKPVYTLRVTAKKG